MRRITAAIFAAICFLYVNTARAGSTLTTAGDILQVAIPSFAFATSLYKDDQEGVKQFGKSFILNTALTHAVKLATRDSGWGERPNGGTDSFPSGHTSSAFQGAFFLQTRYGKEYGVPSIALASLTGYSRIQGNCHHWRDVMGGGLIAFAVNYFIVDEYKDKVSISLNKDFAMIKMKLYF